MRTIPLTVLKGGINRLRTKGGARADSLYDLLNGQLTDAGTVAARPGTRRKALVLPTTKGLVSFDGSLHVFSHTAVSVPTGYTLHVLAHPTTTDNPPEILKIHFAAPFMGSLYVVAEFVGGDIFHFWRTPAGEWTADNHYLAGDIVEPTTPTGLMFRATRLGAPYPSWAPSVPRTVADIVEPTVYNDFYYEVADTSGAAPASGLTEPTWPTTDGSQVVEDTDADTAITTPGVNPGPDLAPIPSDVHERYGQ